MDTAKAQKAAEKIAGYKRIQTRVEKILQILCENVRLHTDLDNQTKLHKASAKKYEEEIQKKDEENHGLTEKVKELAEKVKKLGEELLKITKKKEELEKDLDAALEQVQTTEEGREWYVRHIFSSSSEKMGRKEEDTGAGNQTPEQTPDSSSPPDAGTGAVHSYGGADKFNKEKKGHTPRPKGRKSAMFLRMMAMLDSSSLAKTLDEVRNQLLELKEKRGEITRIEVVDVTPSYTVELERIRPHANVSVKFKLKLYFKEGDPVIWESSSTRIRKGSTYGASFVAVAAYYKYFLGFPIERMAKEFQAQEINLPGGSINAAVNSAAVHYFRPVAKYMLSQLLKQENTVSDETYMSVFGVEADSNEEDADSDSDNSKETSDDKKNGKKIKKGVFWVFTTSELFKGNKIVVVTFSNTRGKSFIEEIYVGYNGTLNTDAYCVYKSLASITGEGLILCFCWAHLRRRVFNAYKVLENATSKKGKSKEEVKKELEESNEWKALAMISDIFVLEGLLKNASESKRLEIRQKELAPRINQFFAFMESLNTDDPSMTMTMKDAVNYTLNNKEFFLNFLLNPGAAMTNNYIERLNRYIARMRHASLFCGSRAGADNTAAYLTLFLTAMVNDADPELYVEFLLQKISEEEEKERKADRKKNADETGKAEKAEGTWKTNETFLESLMPWSQSYRKFEEEQKKGRSFNLDPEEKIQAILEDAQKGLVRFQEIVQEIQETDVVSSVQKILDLLKSNLEEMTGEGQDFKETHSHAEKELHSPMYFKDLDFNAIQDEVEKDMTAGSTSDGNGIPENAGSEESHAHSAMDQESSSSGDGDTPGKVPDSADVFSQKEPDPALDSEKETSGNAGGTVVNDDSECNDPRQSDVQGTTMPFSASPVPDEDAASREVSKSVEVSNQEEPDPALDSEKETSGNAVNDDSESNDPRQPDVQGTTMPFSASPVPEEDTASGEVSKSVEVSNQEEPDPALNSEKETSEDAGGTAVNDDSESNDPRQPDVRATTMPFSAAPVPEEDTASGEVSESVETPDQETPAAMQYYMEETVEDSGKTCSDETAFHASGIPGVSFVMSTVHPTGDSTPGIDLGTSTGEVFESSTVFGEATGPPGSS